MDGSVSGILQIALLGVLGIAELVCFAVLVARAAIRLRGAGAVTGNDHRVGV
ncbi:hypothetical protein ACIBI9_62770 [Nonomuraea sp. NPDC050451]|uniref:hypothetical protein n=1 Tax=Nonomuraea sp. NPDC050451 TaxID=3364364 RepID=UPI0037B0B10B